MASCIELSKVLVSIMAKIRVLIVDDSVVVRRFLADALGSDPLIEVVGTAANGKIAIAKLDQVSPDLITLDIEMPEMDGLETLTRIREVRPKLPVIMFSSYTERGATATLDALSLGASDYVTKPEGMSDLDAARERIHQQLLPKVKALGARSLGLDLGQMGAAKPRRTPSTRTPPSKITLLAIGGSTGGPNALAAILPRLPATFPVPILIAQHMPPLFTRLLAERLSSKCSFPVHEGAKASRLSPARAWIAPGDYHMVTAPRGGETWIQTHQQPPENSCRPSVDVLFRSLAASHGAGVLAVVLTGMGRDGLRGCEDIKERGGQVVVQDEASSVVWGMPGQIARAGLADAIVPLAEIADEILTRVCCVPKAIKPNGAC